MTFLKTPNDKRVIWIQGKQGHEGKTFLRQYIKFYFGGRQVLEVQGIAMWKNDIVRHLSKHCAEHKDIFLFNHPPSATGQIPYTLLENIKDGRIRSNGREFTFVTPNTVIVFLRQHPKSLSLKRECWRIHEIKGDELSEKLWWWFNKRWAVDAYHEDCTVCNDISLCHSLDGWFEANMRTSFSKGRTSVNPLIFW